MWRALFAAVLLAVFGCVSNARTRPGPAEPLYFRDDFDKKDPEWGKVNLVIKKGTDGSMQITRQPVPEIPAEFKKIIEEMK